MCTLIVALQTTPGVPLLIAANRDEKLDRPALPPQLSGSGDGAVLAPVDLAGGGTWLGVTRRGLVVGVTNRFGHLPDPQRRSRGLLVRDLLAAPDVTTAADRAASIDSALYNPFHLVVADAQSGHLIWHDGTAIQRQPLAPGVHVVIERSLGAAPSQREGRVREQATALAGQPFELSAWHALLAEHIDPPFESACVHVDSLGYGTRSSSIIRVDERGLRSLLFADGAPCRTEFVEIGDQVRENGSMSAPPNANLGRCWQRNPDFVARKIAGEFVLVPIRRRAADLDSIFTLNPVASRVWELLDGSRNLAAVRDRLVEEFEVEPATATADLVELIDQLRQFDAVQVK